MNVRPLIPLLALTFAGCKGGSNGGYVPKAASQIPPASVKPGEEQSLFPLAPGNEWTFTVSAEGATQAVRRKTEGEVTLRVVDVQPEGDGKRATLEMVAKGKVTERQVWLVNSKGIFQTGKGAKDIKMFSSPEPVMLFPIEVGKKNKWTGTEGAVKRSYDFLCSGTQEVDTDEKRMSAYSVESRGMNQVGKNQEQTIGTVWLAPGVGIVRYTELTAAKNIVVQNVLKLKSHKVK